MNIPANRPRPRKISAKYAPLFEGGVAARPREAHWVIRRCVLPRHVYRKHANEIEEFFLQVLVNVGPIFFEDYYTEDSLSEEGEKYVSFRNSHQFSDGLAESLDATTHHKGDSKVWEYFLYADYILWCAANRRENGSHE